MGDHRKFFKNRVAQLAEHWAGIPKVVGSNPTVAWHIFQTCPVWMYTQSNITQESYYRTVYGKCVHSSFKRFDRLSIISVSHNPEDRDWKHRLIKTLILLICHPGLFGRLSSDSGGGALTKRGAPGVDLF